MVVQKKADEKEAQQNKTNESTQGSETTTCCSETEECTSEVSEASSTAQGERIVRNHMLTAMGVGLIPFPIVDMVGITGVQLNMLRKLSNIYEVPFAEHKVKNILASLLGGGSTVPLSGSLLSLTKMIPGIGQAVGAVTMPVTAGASTYAVGMVFHQHFASGGTFLTFDPDKVRDYYAKMLAKGKAVASAA